MGTNYRKSRRAQTCPKSPPTSASRKALVHSFTVCCFLLTTNSPISLCTSVLRSLTIWTFCRDCNNLNVYASLLIFKASKKGTEQSLSLPAVDKGSNSLTPCKTRFPTYLIVLFRPRHLLTLQSSRYASLRVNLGE